MLDNFIFKANVLKGRRFIKFPNAFCSDKASTTWLAKNGVASSDKLLFNLRTSSVYLSSSTSIKQPQDKLYANIPFVKCVFDFYNQVF